MKNFFLSVHDVVDTVLRSGPLDTRIFNRASMEEGTHLHSLYQSMQGGEYQSEYPISLTFQIGEYLYHVNGKADGVIFHDDGSITVEEIKTTVADLGTFIKDYGQWHQGQALFYAYSIAKERKCEKAHVVMTYIRQQNFLTQKHIEQEFSLAELEHAVNDIMMQFDTFMHKMEHFHKLRDDSLGNLVFPFKAFRPGQDELLDFVSRGSSAEKALFVEAPTGIGKTVSVLYPLLEKFKGGKARHVYYLTSKNSIKKVAMDTLHLFCAGGVHIKSLEMTARDNICFNDKKGHCNPLECPYSKDYYTKLNAHLLDLLSQHDTISRDVLESFCYENKTCPYQLSLDLAPHMDTVVMDYSYVYDIGVSPLLFPEEESKKDSYLAVDECHNLPDRVRDMYSGELNVYDLKESLTLFGQSEFKEVRKTLKAVIKDIQNYPVSEEDENVALHSLSILEDITGPLEGDMKKAVQAFKSAIKKEAFLMNDSQMEAFFYLNSFYNLLLLYETQELHDIFLCYLRIDDKLRPKSIRISDMDPRPLIEAGGKSFSSTVFFSATLSPKAYYIDLLGGDLTDENSQLSLPSPFPEENRLVFVDSRYSLRYRDRKASLYGVFEDILTAVKAKKGNYFVFCPSFSYLDDLNALFQEHPVEGYDLFVQGHSMSEEGRAAFLGHFQSHNEKPAIGLLVLGGIFSEGIDLVGDRLIGAIIISVGLPQLSFERDQIKTYYNKTEGEKGRQIGFGYAYSFPGFNRILQAAGRVIRTEKDKGIILFIDSRLRGANYRRALLSLYPKLQYLYSKSQLETQLRLFWKEKKNEI